MITKYGQGNKINQDMQKWLVDTEAEIATIPKCLMGSTAYVITTGETWMIDSTGKWYVMGSINKEPIECNCDCVGELTVWGDLEDLITI